MGGQGREQGASPALGGPAKVRTKPGPAGTVGAGRILRARFAAMSVNQLPAALAFRPELTGLRAVAVSIVLVQHWVRPAFPLGELGPSLFFVLSGYLVSGIIWKYGAWAGAPGPWARRLGTFYLRRALRIGPAYYLALAGCALLPLAAVRAHPAWFLLPAANLLTYQSRGWADGVGHFWTIAVEVQFYLLWPWVLGLFGRRLGPLLALVGLSWLFRWGWSVGVRPDMVHLLLPANLDFFALGAVLCLAQGRAWLLRLARGSYVLLAWLGWVALRLLPDPGLGAALGAGVWLAATDFLTIAWLLHRPGAGPRLSLRHPAVQWVGRRSYGLYLFHLPLLVFWQRLVYHFVPDAAGRAILIAPGPVLLALGPVLALLGAASWRWVEAPIDRFKDRFRYADATPLSQPSRQPLG